MIIMGFWTYVEIAIGIVISCLPVLPRLFQACGPRIYGMFSLRSKLTGMTPSEAQPSRNTPIKGFSGKKEQNGYVDGYDMQTEVSGEYSPLHGQHGLPPRPGGTVTNDSSRTSLGPSPDGPAPGWDECIKGEKQRGQILRTTHIETEMEPEINAANVSRADLERQQLGW